MSGRRHNAPKQGPSRMLCRKIRRHRRAFLAYDRLAPLGDPVDPRFCPRRIDDLDRWQARETDAGSLLPIPAALD